MLVTTLRFASDDDLLKLEPNIEQIWPRRDKNGNPRNNWDVQHGLAMDEIERQLRSRKAVSEPIELGRLGIRTKERLRPVAACFALYFMFVAADTFGDDSGFYARKANLYRERAEDMLEQESITIDYDADNSGTIDDFEKNQPMPERFVRG